MMPAIISINIEKPEIVDEKTKRVWTHFYLYNNIHTPLLIILLRLKGGNQFY